MERNLKTDTYKHSTIFFTWLEDYASEWMCIIFIIIIIIITINITIIIIIIITIIVVVIIIIIWITFTCLCKWMNVQYIWYHCYYYH